MIVNHQLESAKKDGGSPTTEVNKWLRDVEEFVAKIHSLQAGMIADDRRLCGCLCHSM